MKTCLGTRTGQKNPRKGVQMAPEHESVFGATGPIQHFWSAGWHSKMAKFP